MRNTMFKLAGVKTEKDFYKKFPSEKAFMAKHGKAFKAKYGKIIPKARYGFQSTTNDSENGFGSFNQSSVDEEGFGLDFLGKNVGGTGAAKSIEGAGKGLFGGLKDELGENAGAYIQAGTDIISGISAIKGQKDAVKVARQEAKVSGIARGASESIDIDSSRQMADVNQQKYESLMRPTNGEERAPVNGVGTNVLSGKHGETLYAQAPKRTMKKLYSDEESMPDNYKYGGKIESYQEGGFAKVMNTKGMDGFLNKASSAITGGQDAGSQIGGGVGQAAGTALFGPVGGKVGKFAGEIIGGVIDTSDNKIGKDNDIFDNNMDAIANVSRAKGIQSANSAVLQHGGTIYEDGGEVTALRGGSAETASYNPHTFGGETGIINGRSHNDGGVLLDYEGNKIEAQGGEPYFMMEQGGQAESMVILGDMPITKDSAKLIGDETAAGKKFQTLGKNYSKNEEKINKRLTSIASKKLKYGGTSVGKIEKKTKELIAQGGDDQLEKIAELKENAAMVQQAIHDTADELGMGDNPKLVARGGKPLEKQLTKINKKASKALNAQYGKTIMGDDPDHNRGVGTFDNGVDYDARQEYEDLQRIKTSDNKSSNTGRGRTMTEGKGTGDVDGSIRGGFDPQSRNDDGSYGKVTPEKWEAFKSKNSWFDFDGFDLNSKEDGMRLQKGINARTKGGRVTEDGNVGNQTISYSERPQLDKLPAKEIETSGESKLIEGKPKGITIEEPSEPSDPKKKGFNPIPYLNALAPLTRKSDAERLSGNQLYGEMFAMANNNEEPVQAQSYNPELDVPYDISYQDALNRNTSNLRGAQKMSQGNSSAQAMLQAQNYGADQQVLAQEFRANQAKKDQVYSGNRATLNDAKLKNLAIFDQQATRQSQAKSNTKATTQLALNSISDKYAKNRLEQRQLKTYENMYNYRFGSDHVANNRNPLADFEAMGGKTGGTSGIPEGYEVTGYDKDGNARLKKKGTKTTDTGFAKYGSMVKSFKHF